MNYVILGRTNLAVSELSLGGLFTSSLGPGFELSKQAVFQALDLGINYIDTAPAYADSEATLGKILKEVRSVPLLLSTKLGGRPKPFDPQNAEQLIASVEESLQLLGREVIDVLFIHEPDRPQQYNWWTDPEAVVGPVIEAIQKLQQQGKIRFSGLGGTTSTEMAHYLRSNQFDVVLTAFNYSALFREAMYDVLPTAAELNIGVVLASVLQQGGLGRRYDAEVARKPAWLAKPRQCQFLEFYKFLDETGYSIVELCLRFAISNPLAATVLIGPKTPEQIRESVTAVEKGALPEDIMTRLDEIASMVPFRPFEEPMILPFNKPGTYYGPGRANNGSGIPVGKQ